ncbi:hypothetical protein H0X09_01275 [Candidatus Saccharibacteria bacterium]|nr:hypothetical protein [Candidatus Saccharibacteria bacterium]
MKRLSLFTAVTALVFSLGTATAYAQYTSPNYKTEEAFFGTGGEVETTSPSYRAQSAIGALGIDPVTGTAYKAYSGFLTPNEPFLEFGVDTSVVDLGTLDTTVAKTGTANFHVRAYINGTYTVKTISPPPSITSGGTYTLAGMGTQGASVAGTEQFGINLKANTSPAAFGAEVAPQPDATFAFGQAGTGYSVANQFKYVAGDTIAQTTTSGWGLTNYTISYIANIGLLTPAGSYSVLHDLVVVATF